MRFGRLTASTLTGLGLLVLCSPIAYAGGNGYGTPGGTSGGTTAPGFESVLTSQTVGSQGGTLNTSYNGTSYQIVVPPGAFSSNEQITITQGNPTTLVLTVPSTDSVVAAVGVNFSGAVPTQGITLVVKNANIHPGDAVYKDQGGQLKPVKSVVSNGEAQITFTSDPDFLVLHKGGSVVTGGTSPVTGFPLFRTLAEGMVLALFGGLLFLYSRPRKVGRHAIKKH